MAESKELDRSLVLQRFSSRVLWHFTGYGKSDDEAFERLSSIIDQRCLRTGSKNETVHKPDRKPRHGYPVACMCDIPFGDLRIHMERYGRFGMAFFKDAAINLGHFNPVLYLHKSSPILRHATDLVSQLEKTVDADSPINTPLQQLLLLLGSYCKPSDLNHPAIPSPEKDLSQDNNFYYEREWRTVNSWQYPDAAVAAIMVPVKYFGKFKSAWSDRFAGSSLISSEMVGML